MKKNAILLRKNAIKSLIKSEAIENQETLVKLLIERHGIITNQSIVSRDLHDLGVGKKKYKDTMIYELQSEEDDTNKALLKKAVINIEHNENVIVITVMPGLGDFIADYLDLEKERLNIIGTIAGENMIFVVPKTVKGITETCKKIAIFLYFKEFIHHNEGK
jgi:transcriptional regulator of arginine metabolism